MTKTPSKLSIIFSFRNEAEVLPELLKRVQLSTEILIKKAVISEYELIFVDDCSDDSSYSLLLEASKKSQCIKIIRMSRNFGVAPCILAGMKYAMGDMVVYMDADLQDPPELIEEMIKLMEQDNSDVVHTVRKKRLGESNFKLWVTRLGYAILNKCASVYLPIEAGDFKLLSRRIVNQLIRFNENQPFVRGLICWIGFKHSFLPYERQPRFAGQTKFKVLSLKVINNFFGSALVSFSSAPLKISSLLGLMTMFLCFIFMFYAVYQILSGQGLPETVMLIVVMLFLGGIQLFCMGIMGFYINAIYEQGKGRPQYIVESFHGFYSLENPILSNAPIKQSNTIK